MAINTIQSKDAPNINWEEIARMIQCPWHFYVSYTDKRHGLFGKIPIIDGAWSLTTLLINDKVHYRVDGIHGKSLLTTELQDAIMYLQREIFQYVSEGRIYGKR
jgi:hypothetical protein